MNNQQKTPPLVSVILPTYNNQQLLESSVWSVLTQDFTDFELIIINDGSTDNTKQIIEKLQQKDSRIKLLNQENQGIVASLNRGLKAASGDYIARIDGDDQWLPHKLKTQIKIVTEQPEVILVSGGVERIDTQDRPIGFGFSCHSDEDIKRTMVITNPLVHSGVLFNKKIALEYGGYPDLCPIEDYALFSKMIGKGKFYNIPYPIVRYRVNPEGISLSNSSKQNQMARQQSLKNWEKFPPEALSRKEIKQKSKDLLNVSITSDFGVSFKHYFLFINTRIGYRMIRKGNVAKGLLQLFNIASTGRTGLKIVFNEGVGATKNILK